MRELSSIDTTAASTSSLNWKKQTRTAFMICHLVPLMNKALIAYRRDVCHRGLK
jgi:hypothetical protein